MKSGTSDAGTAVTNGSPAGPSEGPSGTEGLTGLGSMQTWKPLSFWLVQALAATMKPPCGPEDTATAVMRRTFPGWGSRYSMSLADGHCMIVHCRKSTMLASCMFQGCMGR